MLCHGAVLVPDAVLGNRSGAHSRWPTPYCCVAAFQYKHSSKYHAILVPTAPSSLIDAVGAIAATGDADADAAATGHESEYSDAEEV